MAEFVRFIRALKAGPEDGDAVSEPGQFAGDMLECCFGPSGHPVQPRQR
jgi:hypothetical protein